MREKEKLITATGRCFQTADAQDVAALEALLVKDPPELMRQCRVIVQAANAVLDEEGRQLASIFESRGTPLVCKAGCTGCCRQLVLCRPYEAENIHAYLEAHPQKLLAFRAAYALWDNATASMRHSYLVWAENRYSRGHDDGSHAFEDYQAPCPFLDEQGCCHIYPVRPYGCRTCVALDPACATSGAIFATTSSATPDVTSGITSGITSATMPGTASSHSQNKNLYLHYSLYTTHHTVRESITTMLLRHLGADTTPVPMPDMLATLCGITSTTSHRKPQS